MRENNQRRNPFLLAPTILFPTVLLFGIASFIFSEPFGQANSWWIAALLFVFTFGLPIAMFFYLRGRKWISSCLLPLTGRGFMLSIGAALLMGVQSTWFRSLIIDGSYDHRIYDFYGLSFEIATDSAEKILTAIFAFALLPAILEGVLCRGIFMYEYRFGGVVLSVLMSSALCAVTGVTVPGAILHFLNGIVLSVVVFITGNFIYSVFAYFMVLVYSLFWEKYLLFLALEIETRSLLLFILLGTWITAMVIFCDNAERILRKRGEMENPKPRTLSVKRSFSVFYDMISAPMLWADILIFSVFAVLHLFL